MWNTVDSQLEMYIATQKELTHFNNCKQTNKMASVEKKKLYQAREI